MYASSLYKIKSVFYPHGKLFRVSDNSNIKLSILERTSEIKIDVL